MAIFVNVKVVNNTSRFCVAQLMSVLRVTVLLMVWLGGQAQSQEVIRAYGLRSGLNEVVTQLLNDDQGVLWAAGTEALYRFQGGRFLEVAEVSKILDGPIQDLCTHTDGSLLVILESKAIRFDGREADFVEGEFCQQLPKPEREQAEKVYVMLDIAPGGTLLGTDKGLLYSDLQSETATLLSEDARLSDPILDMVFDRSNALWIATENNGLLRRQVLERTVCIPGKLNSPCILSASGSVAAVTSENEVAIIGSENSSSLIVEDTAKRINFLFSDDVVGLLVVYKTGEISRLAGDTLVSMSIVGLDPAKGPIEIYQGGDAGLVAFQEQTAYQLETNTMMIRAFRIGQRLSRPTFALLTSQGDLLTAEGNNVILTDASNPRRQYLASTEISAVESIEGGVLLGLESGDIEYYDGFRSGVLFEHREPGSERILAMDIDGTTLTVVSSKAIYTGTFSQRDMSLSQWRRLEAFDEQGRSSDAVAASEGLVATCGLDEMCIFRVQQRIVPEVEPYVQFLEVRTPGAGPVESGPFWQQREPTLLPHPYTAIGFEWDAGSLVDDFVTFQYRLTPDKNWSEPALVRSVLFNALRPGDYTFEVRACTMSGVCSVPVTWSFSVSSPWWDNALVLGGLGVLGILVTVVGFRIRERSLRKKADRELEVVQARLQASELKQKMLQLQMSPHFIFNAMQSLSNRIAVGDMESATSQLSSISRMMRSMLNMSRSELVSLESELDFLQSYVAVERMLSDEEIQLTTEMGPEVEPFGEMLPSMMLQPLVENAVKHGGPQINIEFQRRGKCLDITVSDNGPGFGDFKFEDSDSVALNVLRERISSMSGSSIRFSNKPSGGARVELNLCI